MKLVSSGRDFGSFWIEQVGEEVLVGSAMPSAVLLRLKGDAAKRVYELMRRDDAREIPGLYNCHAAAEFVLFGRNADRIREVDADTEIPVTQMSVREAVDTLELPCGFQLYSMITDDDGGYGFYVSHSAVLLGITEAGEALAFEKDGRGPLRICSMETVRRDQKRTTMDKAYFYGTPKTPTA
ncbi:MAG TPA: hypothetical protein PKV72_02710 [Candidatus Peribacteria bacterium]|nr:hypothetical protein [Candidatus Peribacteria bacterium]